MNKIQEVKQRADIVRVAEYFGIKKKQVCPFHQEKTASFSISQSKQIFHCFGCGVGGDCITLVSKLLNINAYESAKQINNIFSLGINFNGYTPKYEVNRYKQIQEAKEKFKKWHNETLQLLCKYLHSLQGIKKLQEVHPDVEIYTSAVDEHLNEKGYIVPGLGDAGDRIFGTK